MSQKKVDRYKKEKRNRKKIMRREKWTRRLEITLIVVVLGGLITWFSVAVYKQTKADNEATASATTIDLDLNDIQNFLTDLSSEASEETSSDSTEASSGSDESVTSGSTASESVASSSSESTSSSSAG